MAAPTPRIAAAVRTPDATSFFNWAESAYPGYFPAPTQSNKTIDVWTYRYYPQTDIYLGANTSGDVLGLVGKGGGAYDSYRLGKIASFGCSVYPSDCAVVVSVPTVSTLAGPEAYFSQPWGVVVDSVGNVFVADMTSKVIRKVSPAGTVTTFAGNGTGQFIVDGIGAAATFSSPFGVTLDSVGNVYVGDSESIRKISPTGAVSTIAGNSANKVLSMGLVRKLLLIMQEELQSIAVATCMLRIWLTTQFGR
jgi:hypothetical protein